MMAPQKFKVGDVVGFFARPNADPPRAGKVIWARGDGKPLDTLLSEMCKSGGLRFFFSGRNPSWDYVVKTAGPESGRQLFALFEANMTLTQDIP
jgi:hypothetical protein